MLVLLLVACGPSGPEVVSAEEIGVMDQSPEITGRDGGLSSELFGRSVWVYGDTVLSVEDTFGQNWHHNSVSWTDDLDPTDGLGPFTEPHDAVGAPLHLIPPSDEEQAFNLAHQGDDCADPCGARWGIWPGNPVWDPVAEHALIPYGLLYAEPGEFNFEVVGNSFATWTALDAVSVRPAIGRYDDYPDLLWTDAEGWGISPTLVGDHLYLFGCEGDLGKPCRLIRAPRERWDDPAAWRGWRDGDWVEVSRAEKLFEGAPIMQVAWNDHLDAWIAVYSHPFSEDVVARTAPELTGPWSRESVLFTTDDVPYDAVHHPELALDGGELLVTYSRGTGGWFDTEFPMWRVTLR